MHRFLAFLRPLRGRTHHFLYMFHLLYNWPCIGWYPGVLQRRVMDGRIKRSSKCCNFYIYYEVDDDEVPSVLSLDEYGSEEEGGWLLLEAGGATV